MKGLIRLFMALHVALYRLSGGWLGGTMRDFKVLLLTTRGRKSGRTYVTPLGYFEHESGYVIVASNAGQPDHPAWYYNLKVHPQVTIQVLDKVMPAAAETLSGGSRSQAWQHVIASAPSYAGYERKTTREIPLVFLRVSQ